MRQGDNFQTSFKKALHEVKASGLQLNFNISIALNLTHNKNKLYEAVDC